MQCGAGCEGGCTGVMHLQGYGVELAVKNMEWARARRRA